ncbi:MAG TPA: hypothetical protein VFE50_21460 [Cyclobacteriaceae bacterium]|nr:hypothetical protein [Cyclobacteriaceae bacterium]
MKNSSIKLIFPLLLFSATLNAQSPAPASKMSAVMPPSPEAASLAKFVEVPVSYFNGIPNISIPLYEINEGDIKVPITLSYHASGVKVNEDASWVGLGWSLSAGGDIVVDSRGGNDFTPAFGYHYTTTLRSPIGTVGNGAFEGAGILTEYQAGGTPCSFVAEDGISDYCGKENDLLGADMEPDLHIFNFGTKTGKFIFKKTWNGANILFTSQVIDRQKIKFDFISSPGGTGIKAVDTDGTSYYFEEWEKSRSQTFPEPLNPLPPLVTSYKLTRIESPFTQPASSPRKVVQFQYTNPGVEILSTANISFSEDTKPYAPESNSGNVSHTLLTARILNRIDFSSGYVQFYTSSREDIVFGYKLDSIAVFRTNNERIKSIVFNYGYFVGSSLYGDYYGKFTGLNHSIYTENHRKKRLKLDNIRIKNGSTKEPPYVFNYDMTPMPYKTSMAMDYWGFFNGAIANKTLIPRGTDLSYYYDIPNAFIFNEAAVRKPDEQKMKAGVLKSITYPTGGTTQFSYEAHKFINARTANVTTTLVAEDKNNVLPSVPDVPTSNEVTFAGTTRVSLNITLSGTTDHNLDGQPDGLCHQYLGDGGIRVEIQMKQSGVWTTPANYKWVLCNRPDIINARLDLSNVQFDLAPGTYRLVANCPNDLVSHTMGDALANVTMTYLYPKAAGTTLGGGLRVATITDNPVTGPSIKRIFTYSGGVNLSMPVFTRVLTFSGSLTTALPCLYCEANGDVVQNTGVQIYSNMLASYSNSANGSYVGYPTVTATYEGNEKGKTVYEFKITEDNFSFLPNTLVGVPNANRVDNGYLLVQTDYKFNSSTSTFSPVKKVTNTLEIQDQVMTWVSKFEAVRPYLSNTRRMTPVDTDPPQPGFSSCITCYSFMVNLYPVKMGRLATITSREETYHPDTGAPLIVTKNMTYNADGFPATVSFTGSDGKVRSSQTYYPTDYTEVTTGWLAEMKNRNMIQYPIEALEKIDGAVTTGTYSEFSVHDNMLTPYKDYQVETTTPIASFTASVPNNTMNGAFKLKEAYTYDQYGNIVEVNKSDDISTCMLWNTDKTLPEATVVNAKTRETFHTSFEDAAGVANGTAKTGAKVSQSNFSKALTTLSNGKYVLEYWQRTAGAWNRTNTTVDVTNGTGSNGTYTINITGVSSTAPIDEVRFYPANGQMTTYAHDPLIGLISMMNPNGIVNYFSYDGLGRLKTVFDNDRKIVKNYEYHYKME